MKLPTIAITTALATLLLAGCQTPPAAEGNVAASVLGDTFPYGVLGPPPVESGATAQGPCREYAVDTVTVRTEKVIGAACRQADGTWRPVK